ncbi:hypothetical protein LCGC14_1202100 [marine sediment metagenome]|uniref:Uncharacterized protein n=1 Tax=marine sediment metagenome TaxID=412755 RepID=A0A0F9LL11_9ZZZZ
MTNAIDSFNPDGKAQRDLEHTQLRRLQAVRRVAKWDSVEMRAIDVAINVHIGATFCFDDAIAKLHEALARAGK